MSNRDWAIVAVFPGHKPKTIGRTCHRADADAYLRFLQRHITQGSFYVLYDPEQADTPTELARRNRDRAHPLEPDQ